jgi:translation initiation factor 2D
MEATPRYSSAFRRPRTRVNLPFIPTLTFLPFANLHQHKNITNSTSALYTLAEVKSALLAYVAKHELVNRVEQQYLNVSSDAVFSAALYGSPNAKGGAVSVPEFAKRDDALSALCGRMQPWYRIAIGSDEPFTKKGTLRPITVASKTRQGRKVCTFITGFEQYRLSGEALAEALRVRCASSTSGTYCTVFFGFKLSPFLI